MGHCALCFCCPVPRLSRLMKTDPCEAQKTNIHKFLEIPISPGCMVWGHQAPETGGCLVFLFIMHIKRYGLTRKRHDTAVVSLLFCDSTTSGELKGRGPTPKPPSWCNDAHQDLPMGWSQIPVPQFPPCKIRKAGSVFMFRQHTEGHFWGRSPPYTQVHSHSQSIRQMGYAECCLELHTAGQ